MSTFTSILSRDCEEVMALELGLSFFGSFSILFSSYLLYPNFPFDIASELDLPNSLKIPNLFYSTSTRMAMVRKMSMTCAFIFENVSFDSSYGFYFYTRLSWLGFWDFFHQFSILQLLTKTPNKISLIPRWFVNCHR